MATNITETRNAASDWLKREADSHYSREEIVVVSGEGVLESGTILGKITASGKYRRHTVAGADGGETAAAILMWKVDATSADAAGVAVVRDAIVAQQALLYGTDVDTAPERAAVNAAFAALSPPIIVREGA